MRIALISSGPSLRQFPSEELAERFALCIGVNRAACRVPCDWWSVGDEQTIRRHAPDGVSFGSPHDDDQRQEALLHSLDGCLPAVLTMMPAMEAIERQNSRYFSQFRRWMTWEQLRDSLRDLPATAFDYSAPLGLALAVHLGASEIECFGVDMAGEADFAGEHHRRFSPHRWQKERAVWSSLESWALCRGVSVTRNSMEACPC